MALIDKASLLMVPSTYEAGKLYNVLPSGNRAPDETGSHSGYDQTRADFSFDRGSNAAATRVNADGLIEKYRENLLLQSNQFDTTWTNFNSTDTSGQSGYDGTNDAWLLQITAASGSIRQNISNSGVQTLSLYAKAGTTDWVALYVAATSPPYCFFDLTNGVKGATQNNVIHSTITDVGNGWYRITATFDKTITDVRIFPAEANAVLASTVGDNIYIQNAQLESGLVATDYLESTSVTGKAGVLIDLPRIDYSSGSGALLLEPSRQNLFSFSEYIHGWLNAGGTSSQNSQDSTTPEGVYNSAVLDASSVRYNTFSISSSAHTYSVYAKAKSGSVLGLRIDTPATKTTNFDLSDGTISSTGSGHTASIEDAGNGWYRCIISFTDSIVNAVLQTTASGSVYVWGAQLEAGSYVSSYIPNHGESGGVTRAADSCSVTGASDAIGQTEGTLFVEFDKKNGTGERRFFLQIGSGSTTIYARLESNNSLTTQILNGGTDYLTSTGTIIPSGNNKFAIGYANNDAVIYLNGTQLASSSSVVVPALSSLYVGSNSSNAQTIAGEIKQTTLFNERLTNEELATLTTL